MSEKARALVIEDEADVREFLCLHLKRDGIEALAVETAEQGLEAVGTHPTLDIALVDWMLPGITGVEFARRMQGRIPILMITARAEPADIVLGLEAGADDFITKPFDIAVLMARVRAVIRRAKRGPSDPSPQTRLVLRGLKLDTQTYDVTCNGDALALTPSEFKLLKSLMLHPGKVLTRERLISLVQGEGVSVVDRAIDTHVFGLRKKLGPCADILETVRGVGYRVQSE